MACRLWEQLTTDIYWWLDPMGQFIDPLRLGSDAFIIAGMFGVDQNGHPVQELIGWREIHQNQLVPVFAVRLPLILRRDEPAPSSVPWSFPGNDGLDVSIDGDNIVTVTNPGNACQDPETVTFTAIATACGEEVRGSTAALFTPNQHLRIAQKQRRVWTASGRQTTSL